WKSICSGRALEPLSPERIPRLKVRGEHNRLNAAAAATMAQALGIDIRASCQALISFTGLPHRLRLVCEVQGRRVYDDSKSTTPAATIAALNSVDGNVWLLLGGAEKQADFADVIKLAKQRAGGAAVFGNVADRLYALIRAHDKSFPCVRCNDLGQALQ